MGRPKTVRNTTRTTIYIFKKDVVEEHMLSQGEKYFMNYINALIREDIAKNGKEEIVKKYFKE